MRQLLSRDCCFHTIEDEQLTVTIIYEACAPRTPSARGAAALSPLRGRGHRATLHGQLVAPGVRGDDGLALTVQKRHHARDVVHSQLFFLPPRVPAHLQLPQLPRARATTLAARILEEVHVYPLPLQTYVRNASANRNPPFRWCPSQADWPHTGRRRERMTRVQELAGARTPLGRRLPQPCAGLASAS